MKLFSSVQIRSANQTPALIIQVIHVLVWINPQLKTVIAPEEKQKELGMHSNFPLVIYKQKGSLGKEKGKGYVGRREGVDLEHRSWIGKKVSAIVPGEVFRWTQNWIADFYSTFASSAVFWKGNIWVAILSIFIFR